MDHAGLISDILRLSLYALSFGMGYIGAVVVERRKYHELLFATELSVMRRLGLIALISVATFTCHFLGVAIGGLMAFLCSVGLLDMMGVSYFVRESIGIGIIFIISGVCACYGAGDTIASMWQKYRLQKAS